MPKKKLRPIREDSAAFDQLLATLEAHGAGTPEGWQVTQLELAALAGFKNKREMYDYLRRAKLHGLVAVEQYRGFGFGDRQADRYRLRVTVAQWNDGMRAELCARVRVEMTERSKAARRVAMMERARRAKAAARVHEVTPGGPGPLLPVPVDVEAVSRRVAAMAPDEDLAGW